MIALQRAAECQHSAKCAACRRSLVDALPTILAMASELAAVKSELERRIGYRALAQKAADAEQRADAAEQRERELMGAVLWLLQDPGFSRQSAVTSLDCYDATPVSAAAALIEANRKAGG